MNQTLQAQRCPLCDEPNDCAVANGRDPAACWCLSAEALEGVKQALAATPDRCGCQRCFTGSPKPTQDVT